MEEGDHHLCLPLLGVEGKPAQRETGDEGDHNFPIPPL